MSRDDPSDFSTFRPFEQIAQAHRGDPDFMLSLARGIHVLLAFADRKTPSSVAEVARKTSLDRAVVRRCIYTLERLGMVRADGGKYLLESNVLSLGHAYFSSIDVVYRAQPLLDELGDSIHTNCALALLNGNDVVYLVRSQSRRLMHRSLGMGSRLPAHCTSLGRILLAHLPEQALTDYLAHAARPQLTPYTITDAAKLQRILGQVREDGYVVVSQEVELDLVGIAIPVRMKGFPPLLALSVTVNPRYTPAHEMKPRYLAQMQETARRLGSL